MSYYVGDESLITYPVTDTADPPGTLNIPASVQAVKADATTVEITGTWLDAPAATRRLQVPLATLPAGLWSLRLTITGEQDLFLGNVYIE